MGRWRELRRAYCVHKIHLVLMICFNDSKDRILSISQESLFLIEMYIAAIARSFMRLKKYTYCINDPTARREL